MFLTKALTAILITLIGFSAWSQEEVTGETIVAKPKEVRRINSQWGLNLSSIIWNEKLRLSNGSQEIIDYSNYNGLMLTVQKETRIRRWGYTWAAFAAVGQANGGGNSNVISYKQSKQNFTMYGVSPRGFYRLSEKVTTGLTAMAYSRNIDWPASSGQTIDAGPSVAGSVLADFTVRLFNKWDLAQGIGPLVEGGTLWKIGMTYQF